MTVTTSPNGYRELHESFAGSREAPAWIAEIRSRGIAEFGDAGLPTLRDEDWRFTSLEGLRDGAFTLVDGGAPAVDADFVRRTRIAGVDGPCLVFVDGRFAPSLSSTEGLPAGVTCGSLAEAIRRTPDQVRPHLDRLAVSRPEPLTSLNRAFLDDGVFLHVPAGVVVESVYALYVSSPGTATMAHPRNLVVVEREAQAVLVEDFVSADDGAAFTNAVTEIVVGDGATCHHYVVERENDTSTSVTTVHAEQGRDSTFHSHSALLGGGVVRNNVYPRLIGENGWSLLNGFYVPNGEQHHDTFMVVHHVAPRCDSRQFYRGILDGRARGVFSGRIVVHERAQKTDAKQTNRNLLLSDDALIDTKPQLEIYADDVKCTHGATVGQLDPEEIFYLRARGIPEDTARGLLTFAFVNEVVDRMESEPVRRHLRRLLEARLPGVRPSENGA